MSDFTDTASFALYAREAAQRLRKVDSKNELLDYFKDNQEPPAFEAVENRFFGKFARDGTLPRTINDIGHFHLHLGRALDEEWRRKVCELFLGKNVQIVTTSVEGGLRGQASGECTSAYPSNGGICIFVLDYGESYFRIIPQHLTNKAELTGPSGLTTDRRTIRIVT